MASPEPRVATPATINIGTAPDMRGELVFTGSPNIGPHLVITLPNVELAPSAAMNFIGDAYGLMELTGEVLADPVTGSFGTVQHPDGTIVAPNIVNYMVGTGVITWQGPGDTTPVDLGNCDLFEVTPTVERLPHWNHRTGIRKQDLNPVVQQGCTCRLTLDEFCAKNLQIALLGTLGP
jgi:hypothetical protein